MDRGRDLLFGVIALQLGFVTQQQFVEIMALLSHQPDRSAEELFRARGFLPEAPAAAIGRLMLLQLKKNGGDAGRSIQAMGIAPTVAHSLALVSDSAASATTDPGAPPPSAEAPLARVVTRERYRLGDELGRGGVGRVVVAVDGDLMEREVAMKLLHPAGHGTQSKTARRTSDFKGRFLEEAQLTARLQHPNIVAVYELGTSTTGELYYTMPLLRGRTMKAEIAEAHGRRAGASAEEWAVVRMRLLTVFQGVCHAIAYAHSCGVIHRDIKPHNVMVGEFGETVVLDWGLAKLIPGRGETVHGGETISADSTAPSRAESRSDRELQKLMRTLRRRPGQQTAEGSIAGTPAYMAPEQAQGRISEMDERSDIYSLGAMLFEVLSGRPPHLGENAYAVLFRMMTAPTPDPREAAPPGDVDDDIAAICMRCMSRSKEERYPSVKELSREIALYMEGAKERQRRRDQASRLVHVGEQRAREHAQFQREVAELESKVRELSGTFRGPIPIERKRPLWELEDRTATVRREAMTALAEAERSFHKALEWEAANAEARRGLADLYFGQFREAEGAGAADDLHYYRELVESYHDGRYAHALAGDGTLEVETDPPGTHLFLFRYEVRDRRLLPVPWEGAGYTPRVAPGEIATTAGWYLKLSARDATCHVGTSPLARLQIPMGSYLLVARKKGFRDVRCPVSIGRNADVRLALRLYREAEIGAGFVLVPAGEFVHGGDSSIDALPRGTTWLGDYLIGRYPVTCREYLEFLDALAEEDTTKARSHAPRMAEGGSLWEPGPRGRFRLPDAPEDAPGVRFAPDHPVVYVSWDDAVAYCEWRSRRDGRSYRLPSELEREKASRGVDQRRYPWGNTFEPVWCNMVESRNGPARLGPVGEFPTDESPYGVRDLAGNVFDWCANLFDEDKPWRALRGGAFQGGSIWSRTTARAGFMPLQCFSMAGFRLVVDPPDSRRGC